MHDYLLSTLKIGIYSSFVLNNKYDQKFILKLNLNVPSLSEEKIFGKKSIKRGDLGNKNLLSQQNLYICMPYFRLEWITKIVLVRF